jgi:hypothetical protein
MLPHVLASRAVISALLLVMLVAGGAPWRVCSHAHEGHGHVWLPELAHLTSTHHHDHHDGHGHDVGHEHGAPCPHGPECPAGEDERPCHADDQPLLTGMPYTVVAFEAPLAAGWNVDPVDAARGLGAPEVAPSEPDRGRVAREEDPIVLLR